MVEVKWGIVVEFFLLGERRNAGNLFGAFFICFYKKTEVNIFVI